MKKRSRVILAVFLAMVSSIPIIVFATSQEANDGHEQTPQLYAVQCEEFCCTLDEAYHIANHQRDFSFQAAVEVLEQSGRRIVVIPPDPSEPLVAITINGETHYVPPPPTFKIVDADEI